MAKAKAFIPAPVVASVLCIPAVAFAYSSGPLTLEQVRAEQVQLQRTGYYDRSSADTQFSMNFQAALARVAAQRQAFESYGGATSSSTAGSPAHVASDNPVRFDS
ncbi:DUF4148 domain-containing protein [Paraburkholderia sp. SIMBA_030]|uniref:DUF4148 domain-containing protein n=1 Tax=Paraburkholderia sp. SIMBA_030 TaxID=3085773 RepID=UPI00397B83C0